MTIDALVARIEQARNNQQNVREQLPRTRDAIAQTVLAGGLFQELRYVIPRDFNGSRFNISFRRPLRLPPKIDLGRVRKGQCPVRIRPGSSGHLFLNLRTSSAKGLRLDYGSPNKPPTSFKAWHWNQQGGVHSAFRISNHSLASSTATNFGRLTRYGTKPLGQTAWWVGAGIDAYSLGSEIKESSETGNWDNTVVESSRIAGGWGGAYVGAKAGGTIGATIGAFGGPVGAGIGATVGGLVGGAFGYYAGSEAGEHLGEEVTS